jgi:GNAT superfamily N-acetyltransferase
MEFRSFRQKINELERNVIGKDFSTKEGTFPSFFEFDKNYKDFPQKISFKTKSGNVILRYYQKTKDTVYVVPWLMDGDEPQSIGMLHLYKRPVYNAFGYDLYEVKNAYLKEDHQGMGIMPRIYREIVAQGYNIVALDTQSTGARKMWSNFYGKEGYDVWGIIGVRFFVEPERGRTKEDWIETINISNKFITLPENPELSAVVLTDNGVEEVKSMYVDTEGYEELESALILTAPGSDLSEDLESMMNLEEFPEEEALYKTLTSMLLVSAG